MVLQTCMESLQPAEEDLLKKDIALVHQALRAGHLRLTWNNLAIHESCLNIGTKAISVFGSKIEQVHFIRQELTHAVNVVRTGKLLQ